MFPSPPGGWGTDFGVMVGEGGTYRKAVKWRDSITFSEEIENYVKKINE